MKQVLLFASFVLAGFAADAHSDYYRCVRDNPHNYAQVCGSRSCYDRTGKIGPGNCYEDRDDRRDGRRGRGGRGWNSNSSTANYSSSN